MNTAVPALDTAFHALSNSTRRSVVERLGKGPATVSELAEPFEMALPSFMQHLRVLEDSGLVHSTKTGRVRTVHIAPDRFRHVTRWLQKQKALWERRLDQLDAYVLEMEDE